MIEIIKKDIILEIKVMIVIVIIAANIEIKIKKIMILIKMIIMKMIDIMIMIMIDIQIIIIEEVVEEINFGKEKNIINFHPFLSFLFELFNLLKNYL